ncbi:hypothetical protein EIP86_007457 [Pleurotus ostreatoroseus]|nr:hypothetical protein EIP86_007457 [Pleurotus ostreatoroseus]
MVQAPPSPRRACTAMLHRARGAFAPRSISLLHTPRAPRPILRIAPPNTDTQDKVLDQIKLISQLLGAVADGPLNVPGLKGVSGLVEQVVTIVQVGARGSHVARCVRYGQTIRSNKEDCLDLLDKICAHLCLLANTYSSHSEENNIADDPLLMSVLDMESNLTSIIERLNAIASQPRSHRILFHQSNKQQIAKCRQDLVDVIGLFDNAAILATVKDNLELLARARRLQQTITEVKLDINTSTSKLLSMHRQLRTNVDWFVRKPSNLELGGPPLANSYERLETPRCGYGPDLSGLFFARSNQRNPPSNDAT